METVLRWMVRHQRAVRVFLALIYGLVLGALRIRWELPLDMMLALIILGSATLVLVSTYPMIYLQKRALKIMTDQCDPRPFLAEMQTMVSSGLSKSMDAVLRMDLATALHNSGSAQAALDVMAHISVEGNRKLAPVYKALYYNNLAYFRMEAGDFDGAEEAYGRFRELAVGGVLKMLTKNSDETVAMTEAEHLYRLGDYAAALENARQIRHKTAIGKVDGALFRARCALALGDQTMARMELNYVIEHGNYLAAVDKARELLKDL